MKTHAPLIVSLIALITSLPLQAAQPAQPAAAAFELPRLKARGKSGAVQAIAKEHATVDDLSPRDKPTARAGIDRKAKYLALDANSSWSSPVRGAPKDTTFVSFFVYASEGTTINIAGAKLVVRSSSKAGYAKMQVGRAASQGVQWRDIGGPVKLESFEGAALAALPVLTVRLDPKAGVWDLFAGSRLVATDLPLAALPNGATRQFTVQAGAQGARVCGLVSADDNPLFEDENANGIDDAFEKQQNQGSLLATREPAATRTQLARQWQQDQTTSQVASWPVQRPLPDGTPSVPPRQGK